MTEDDRRSRSEPPPRGPSTPPDLHFDPLATGIAVFAGVTIPVVVFGYTRPSGVNTTIIVIGVIIGVIAGVLAGIWVNRRNGEVWRGPQL